MQLKFILNRLWSFLLASRFKRFGNGARVSRSSCITGFKFISIGDHSFIDDDTSISAAFALSHEPRIIIGAGVGIGKRCHITSINYITIGDGSRLGEDVLITDNSHGSFSREQLEMKVDSRPLISNGSVEIGKNVWIGSKASILPNIKIGDGCIIGANTVVTQNIPAYSLAVGNPAKIVKQINYGTI